MCIVMRETELSTDGPTQKSTVIPIVSVKVVVDCRITAHSSLQRDTVFGSVGSVGGGRNYRPNDWTAGLTDPRNNQPCPASNTTCECWVVA